MASSATPSRPIVSPRGRRFDARLAVGILLILLSTAGAYAYLASANTSVEVYVAQETLLAGDAIRETDLRTVPVSLAGVSDSYIRGGELAPGSVATRTIAAGEMLPTKAVGSTASVTNARIVVAVSEGLAPDTDPGTHVDVWATTSDPYSIASSTASVIVPGATFARVMETDAYGLENTQRVELLVPRSALRALLAAQGDGASLVIVPTVSQAG